MEGFANDMAILEVEPNDQWHTISVTARFGEALHHRRRIQHHGALDFAAHTWLVPEAIGIARLDGFVAVKVDLSAVGYPERWRRRAVGGTGGKQA